MAELEQFFPLEIGRAHEVCGAGASAFAAMACGADRSDNARTILWLQLDWQSDIVNPVGMTPFCDPSRIILARAKNQQMLLSCAEEALRSGAVSHVITELYRPLDLTAGRRLQLAAEMGKATGILIVSEGMGSNAAQTRWQCSPECPTSVSDGHNPKTAGLTVLHWELIKNKKGTLGSWKVCWNAQAHRIIVVSEACQ
ncbi:protein ImuA [Pseudovibrio ascidiaceicola]|uniref:Protein ImuA n=1 Tax=Pseudovibrio ascidiaceicola TaxID=285279 RepID=A0A1I4DKY9_9HYPH|nr:hypothetical protein [Pseudovibrio ascidiaceicola]SFK94242.1 protein ImuA [Pseudovibrio ascidiaceicola]